MAIISLKNLTPNQPKANIEDYFFLVYGRPKAGKTSLFAKLVKEHFGSMDKGLLIGFERGFNALSGIYAQEIETWEDFVDLTDQLIDERDGIPFRFLGLDTVDEMYKMATDFVLKRESRKDNKKYKTIGELAWGAGYSMVTSEMGAQISKLSRAGFGLFFITHDTDKKFESRDGVSYDKTTMSLPKQARDLVLNMCDFIIFIDIAKEKDEDGELQDKRYIYFRADGSNLEAGSRFQNIKPRIEYDVKEFLQTFKDAVLAEYDNDVDLESVKKQQAEEREKRANEFIEQQKQETQQSQVDPADIIKEIDSLVANLTEDQKKSVSKEFKSILGITNYRKSTEISGLSQCLEVLKSL